MRRVIVVALAGASLAGCQSATNEYFNPAPKTVQVQLQSVPPGADARTSAGPGCRTPCQVSVPATDASLTVTFTMDKFLPATVPMQVINNPGDFATAPSTRVEPTPVVAELKPAPPPPRAPSKRPKASTPPAASKPPPAAPKPASGSKLPPFPAPLPGR